MVKYQLLHNQDVTTYFASETREDALYAIEIIFQQITLEILQNDYSHVPLTK